MSSRFSVLSPNYRGTKKYNLLVSTRIVVQADFTEYVDVELSNRTASLIYHNRFNRIPIRMNGEDILLEVKEATYSVLDDDYNVGIIDALISFDIYANSIEEATEKMYRTLDGDIALNNFTLSDMDTYNMQFECDILLYEFNHEYMMKEITLYDEAPKKYEQLASLKMLVKGDIPKLIEDIIPEEVPECFGEWNSLYKSDDLSDGDIYKFESFNLSIEGLRKIDYKLLPISFKVIEDGLAEFTFAFKFNVFGYSPDHASDQFESIFVPENITISDFTFIDDENFITTELEVIKIYDTIVEDLAVAL